MARGGARSGRAASGERWAGGAAAGLPAQLTHAASPRPPASLQPRPVLAVSRQPRVVYKRTCTSLKDVSSIPPPARRPWRRSVPRAFLEVTQKRQKGNRAAAAGRDIHWSPPRQRKSKGPSEGRELLRGLSRGWLASRPEGVARPRWGRPRPGSCRGVLGDGEVAVGPAGTLLRGEPRRQLNGSPVCARVGPSGLPDTPQLRCRHLMAKVEETGAGSWAGTAPRPPLDSRPQVGLPSQSAGTFPRF